MYLPIANVVSLWRGGAPIRRAQELAGLEPTSQPWIGVVLAALFAFNIPYHHSQLNRVWSTER